MAGIKKKIIFSFGATITGIILSVIIIIAWQMSQSISTQANLLANDMTKEAKKVVTGHHAIARSYLETVFSDVYASAREVAGEPTLFIMIEEFQVQRLTNYLRLNIAGGKADFGILLDTQGLTQATYPQDIDIIEAENSITAWPIFSKAIKAIDSRLEKGEVQFNDLVELEPNFIDIFKIKTQTSSKQGLLAVVSCVIVLNDLEWPVGMYITGKMLNDYDQPLSQLNQATDSSAILYLHQYPIAQAGIIPRNKEKADTDLSPLNLPLEALAQIEKK